jgi:Zn-finger nucleic acid-binding protein
LNRIALTREVVKPMLLACTACHRQYDVGDHAPGAKVRCLCGTLNTVKALGARQVEMFHCANCGGKLAHGEVRCSYCSAEVRLGTRGLGPACPECFAMTLLDARHCSTCGVALRAEALVRPLAGRACPRCKQELSECETERLRYVECTGCGGLWLDEKIFERVVAERQSIVADTLVHPQSGTARRTLESSVRYLSCPVCAQFMNRKNFGDGSGVILDWCRGHGWWFDAEELARVLEFVESGGLEHVRERRHEERKRELDRLERKSLAAQGLSRMELRRMEAQLGRGPTLPDLLMSVVDFVRRVL